MRLHGKTSASFPVGGVRSFTIGQVCVSLQSDLQESLDDFDLLYRESKTIDPPAAGRIEMAVKTTRRSRMGGRRYSIFGDGEEIFGERRIEEVFPYLEWAINCRVMETRSDYLQFHAATLARDGQAYVFAADSGSGKSTLAAGLLARGWTYLTDELTMVDPESLHAHAFPKALCIKAGSFATVEKLGLSVWKGRNYVKALKGKVGYVNPRRADLRIAKRPCPIRYLIFPRYVEGTAPRLYPISRARAAFGLASRTLNRPAFGDRIMSLVSDIVRGAECFGLTCGSLDVTCGLLDSLGESGGGPPSER